MILPESTSQSGVMRRGRTVCLPTVSVHRGDVRRIVIQLFRTSRVVRHVSALARRGRARVYTDVIVDIECFAICRYERFVEWGVERGIRRRGARRTTESGVQ